MIPGVRILKRLLIFGIAAGTIAVVFWGARYLFEGPAILPTPDPKDSLLPLNILSVNLFQIEESDYDVLIRVHNPNQEYGSGDIKYSLNLYSYGTGGSETFEKFPGSFYILPGQTKYIVVSPVRTSRTVEVERAEIKIESVDWRELDTLALQGVSFVTTNASFSTNLDEGVFGRLRGFIANNSDFDISRVDVAVMLFDEDDKPIAVNRTEIHTFLAATSRGFEVSWFSPFEDTVARTYIEANANLFEQSSFMRTYGGQERFQVY